MSTLFFVLSKIVGFFLNVENWFVFGLALLAVFLVRGKVKSAKGIALGMLLVTLAIGFFPFADPALRHLETQYQKPREISDVEGIILLGGPEQRALSNEWGEPLFGESGERLTETLKLARRFPNAKILVTSGAAYLHDQNDPRPKGADIIANLLMEQGISRDRLIVENRARNTADNARLAQGLVTNTGDNWVLVTSAFHMPRAMRSFENAGWEALVAWPTDYRSLPFWSNIRWDLLQHIAALNVVTHEYVGLVVYRIVAP